MSIRNETLQKNLEVKRDQLQNKIQPLQDELDLTDRMLQELEQHNVKMAMAAETKLGLRSEDKISIGEATGSGAKVTRIDIEEVA